MLKVGKFSLYKRKTPALSEGLVPPHPVLTLAQPISTVWFVSMLVFAERLKTSSFYSGKLIQKPGVLFIYLIFF